MVRARICISNIPLFFNFAFTSGILNLVSSGRKGNYNALCSCVCCFDDNLADIDKNEHISDFQVSVKNEKADITTPWTK